MEVGLWSELFLPWLLRASFHSITEPLEQQHEEHWDGSLDARISVPASTTLATGSLSGSGVLLGPQFAHVSNKRDLPTRLCIRTIWKLSASQIWGFRHY